MIARTKTAAHGWFMRLFYIRSLVALAAAVWLAVSKHAHHPTYTPTTLAEIAGATYLAVVVLLTWLINGSRKGGRR